MKKEINRLLEEVLYERVDYKKAILLLGPRQAARPHWPNNWAPGFQKTISISTGMRYKPALYGNRNS